MHSILLSRKPHTPGSASNLLSGYQELLAAISSPSTAASTLTSAASVSVGFSPVDQTLNLSATITASSPVDGGTVNFIVANIGTVTSGPVAAGVANSTLTITGGTHPGSYQIQAAYGGTTSFASSTGTGMLAIGSRDSCDYLEQSRRHCCRYSPKLHAAQCHRERSRNIHLQSTIRDRVDRWCLTVAGRDFYSTDAVDYNSASASVSINVNQTQAAHLTITAISASRKYGQSQSCIHSFDQWVHKWRHRVGALRVALLH